MHLARIKEAHSGLKRIAFERLAFINRPLFDQYLFSNMFSPLPRLLRSPNLLLYRYILVLYRLSGVLLVILRFPIRLPVQLQFLCKLLFRS